MIRVSRGTRSMLRSHRGMLLIGTTLILPHQYSKKVQINEFDHKEKENIVVEEVEVEEVDGTVSYFKVAGVLLSATGIAAPFATAGLAYLEMLKVGSGSGLILLGSVVPGLGLGFPLVSMGIACYGASRNKKTKIAFWTMCGAALIPIQLFSFLSSACFAYCASYAFFPKFSRNIEKRFLIKISDFH